jgi:signal transduction histidine kinase/CheY-like chemotaxis protein
MKLRSRLYLLVAGAVLPLVGLAVILGLLLVDNERETFQRGVIDRSRAVMTAVDADLRGHIDALQVLAANSTLASGDLREFHYEVVRALVLQPEWSNLILSDSEGRELLVGVRPYGESLPEDPDPDSLARAVATRQPTIGAIRTWKSIGRAAVPIRVPIETNGRVTHVLTAVIPPGRYERLFVAQSLPPDWVLGLVDREFRFIARIPTPPGEFASPAFREAATRTREGWYRGLTAEGRDTFTAHRTSLLSGWSLGIAMPIDRVFASASGFAWALALGTLVTLGLALATAWWMSRRIARPIAALAASARALGRPGRPAAGAGAEGLEEVRDVQHALDAADAAIREREALQQREQDALKAADRSKDEFLAMLGHELRNPLSAITTSSHVLRSAPAGSRMHTQAQVIIERQARQMARLVDDLLDISRLTMGKVALKPEVFDAGQLAPLLVQTWEQSGRVERGRILLEARPAWIVADRARIEQVIANLLDNANRFTPAEGRIRLRVATVADHAVIEVSDEGAGIDPALIDTIFKPFAQAPQGPDRSHGGLGLGLAVVRRLAEMHGGTVTAASPGLGKGATFTVRLPAAEAPEKSEPLQELSRVPPPPGMRVLVIEDGDDAREMLQAMLKLHGHEVRTAGTGLAGVAEAERYEPDVVLLDIGLPDIDGYEVARRLRGMASGSAMRLVALTGYGQSEDEAAAYAAGFDLHVTKPVDPEALANILARLAPAPREAVS